MILRWLLCKLYGHQLTYQADPPACCYCGRTLSHLNEQPPNSARPASPPLRGVRS